MSLSNWQGQSLLIQATKIKSLNLTEKKYSQSQSVEKQRVPEQFLLDGQDSAWLGWTCASLIARWSAPVELDQAMNIDLRAPVCLN